MRRHNIGDSSARSERDIYQQRVDVQDINFDIGMDDDERINDKKVSDSSTTCTEKARSA